MHATVLVIVRKTHVEGDERLFCPLDLTRGQFCWRHKDSVMFGTSLHCLEFNTFCGFANITYHWVYSV